MVGLFVVGLPAYPLYAQTPGTLIYYRQMNQPQSQVKVGGQEGQIVGLASWYGGKFNGRKTASGERFNKNEMTCAHRKLPFGTLLEVTNLANGRTAIVRVNDRGPFHKNRILDFSKAVAEKLGFLGSGVTQVAFTVLPSSSSTEP